VDATDILVTVKVRRRKILNTLRRQKLSPSSDREARGITYCGCALKGAKVFHCTDKLWDMLWARYPIIISVTSVACCVPLTAVACLRHSDVCRRRVTAHNHLTSGICVVPFVA
jgi:hypothetical protein